MNTDQKTERGGTDGKGENNKQKTKDGHKKRVQEGQMEGDIHATNNQCCANTLLRWINGNETKLRASQGQQRSGRLLQSDRKWKETEKNQDIGRRPNEQITTKRRNATFHREGNKDGAIPRMERESSFFPKKRKLGENRTSHIQISTKNRCRIFHAKMTKDTGREKLQRSKTS